LTTKLTLNMGIMLHRTQVRHDGDSKVSTLAPATTEASTLRVRRGEFSSVFAAAYVSRGPVLARTRHDHGWRHV
jgi:hypothetical protein